MNDKDYFDSFLQKQFNGADIGWVLEDNPNPGRNDDTYPSIPYRDDVNNPLPNLNPIPYCLDYPLNPLNILYNTGTILICLGYPVCVRKTDSISIQIFTSIKFNTILSHIKPQLIIIPSSVFVTE